MKPRLAPLGRRWTCSGAGLVETGDDPLFAYLEWEHQMALRNPDFTGRFFRSLPKPWIWYSPEELPTI
jgi:hypothetical protein